MRFFNRSNGLTDQYGNHWQFTQLPGGKIILRGKDGQVSQENGSTVINEPSKVFYPNTQGLPDYWHAGSLVIDENGKIISGTFDWHEGDFG